MLTSINIPDGTKIVIVEGFESVGKTTMMDKLVERSQFNHQANLDKDIKKPLLNLWKPNYSNMTKSFLPYESRYVLNLALLDMVTQSVLELSDDEVLLVDRGLVSGIVYSALKDQDNQEYLLNGEFFKYVESMYSSDFIYHLYVQPQSKEDSLFLYKSSQVDESRDNDEYDIMGNFEKYYEEYLIADKLFLTSMGDVCNDRFSIIDPMNYEEVK